MTEPQTAQTGTLDSAAKPALPGLLSRIIGVIFSPRKTFEAIVATPRWFGMLATYLLMTALLAGGLMFTAVGQQAFLDMMEKQAGARGGQSMEMMQKLAGYMGYIAIGQTLIITPIVLLIIAGILFAVFTAGMGGNATFRQLFAVLVHSEAVSLVAALLKLPLAYTKGTLTASTNLSIFFPMLDDTGFLARFFGMVDLFMVWWVAALAIGLAVLYKRRTGPIAVGFYIVYAIIALGIAAIQAARS